jgi:hypothetical protein
MVKHTSSGEEAFVVKVLFVIYASANGYELKKNVCRIQKLSVLACKVEVQDVTIERWQ